MTETSADRWVSTAHRPMGFSEFVLVVSSIIALNPLALDLMLPALPEMAIAFGIAEPNHLQRVLSVYLLGVGAGQFIVGPLSDRYGRRGLVMFGLILYCLATILALTARSFESLLLARVLQGLGTSSGRVIAVSLVRDCYNGRRLARVMSLTQMVFMAIPILAPSVGALMLAVMHDWRVTFITIFLFGFVLLVWCMLRLPETLGPEDRKPLTIRLVLTYYWRTITTRQTIGYALAAGLIQGTTYSYLLSAQQLLVGYYQLGGYFTIAFAFIAVGILCAGFLNSRLVGRLGMRVMSHSALIGLLILSITLLVAVLNGFAPFWLFLGVAVCTLFCCGLTFANFTALAMEPQGEIAGTASSLFGSITILIGTAMGAIVGQAYDGTIQPLATGFVFSAVTGLAIVLITERGRLFKARNKPI